MFSFSIQRWLKRPFKWGRKWGWWEQLWTRNVRTPGGSVNETELSQGQQQAISEGWDHLISLCGGVRGFSADQRICGLYFLSVSPGHTGQLEVKHDQSLHPFADELWTFSATPFTQNWRTSYKISDISLQGSCPFYFCLLWAPLLSLDTGLSHSVRASIHRVDQSGLLIYTEVWWFKMLLSYF